MHRSLVVSLGSVSPGASTDGVTLFFLEKIHNLFWSSPPGKLWPFLAVISSPLPSSHVIYPVFLSKFSHKIFNFIWLSPPWMVSPVAVRPSSPPSSDATATVKQIIATRQLRSEVSVQNQYSTLHSDTV